MLHVIVSEFKELQGRWMWREFSHVQNAQERSKSRVLILFAPAHNAIEPNRHVLDILEIRQRFLAAAKQTDRLILGELENSRLCQNCKCVNV